MNKRNGKTPIMLMQTFFFEAIRKKRHDEVVCELYCWVKLHAENDKLGRLASFQIWMAENTWDVLADNTLIFSDILNDAQSESPPRLDFSVSAPGEARQRWADALSKPSN